MSTAFSKPLTKHVHPHTRRRAERDRRYINRLTKRMRADRRRALDRDGSTFRDRTGRPITAAEWSALFERDGYRTVAWSNFGDGFSVSTIWQGVDRAWRGRVPLVFETLAVTPYSEIELQTASERMARITHYLIARVIGAAHAKHVATRAGATP